MQKPKDFDTAKATGEYIPLPAGGYICKIIGVEETKSKAGNHMLKIAVDIAEGDEQGRFMDEFRSDTRPDKKWPNSGIIYQLTEDKEGNTHGGFKSFTNCVVESNNGFEIVWGDKFAECFRNKLVGMTFGREQYVNKDGELRWSTKPKFFKTVEQIKSGDFKVPEDKPFDDNGTSGSSGIPSGFGQISDDDIPF